MSIQARPITAADGTITGTLAGLRDVHEQVLAGEALASSERRYRMLAENATDVVWQNDTDGVLRWVSPSVESVLGWAPEQLIGTSPRDLAHPDDRDFSQRQRAKAYGGESVPRFDVRLLCADGSYRWMSLHSQVTTDTDGTATGIIIGLNDVHERVLAERELADSERQFRMLAENATDVVWQLDADDVMGWVSPSVESVLGWTREQLVGTSAIELIHPDDRESREQWRERLIAGVVVPELESRRQKADGSYRWMSLQGRPITDTNGSLTGVIVGLRDIDDEVRTRTALAHAIDHDPLTGLVTLSVAMARIDRWLGALSDRGPDPGIGLLCVGIDALKSVNEAFTHTAGDRVLLTVASRIASVVPSPDLLARGSGDEFYVLLPELASSTDTSVIAEQIRVAAQGTVTIGANHVETTVSIGIAIGGPDAGAEALVRDATLAMHRAKDHGRDRYEFFRPELGQEATDRKIVEERIRLGLQQGQFVPWFQPIVNLGDGSVVGYEALMRWVRPDGSIVAPDDFLPIAERTALIVDLDLAVLKQTIEMLGRLPAPTFIAANLSAATLASPDYAEHALFELARVGVDPTRLHLEFTETALFDVTGRALDIMRDLAADGIGWYVDDFGTGFSSISHLRDMPVTGLKLDLSFTGGLGGADQTSERLARALVGLAEGLGLDTVAEGVETPMQAAILRAQGWKHGQGWLYGHPEPMPVVR